MRRQCLNVRLGVQDHLSISMMCRIWLGANGIWTLQGPSIFYYDEREGFLGERGYYSQKHKIIVIRMGRNKSSGMRKKVRLIPPNFIFYVFSFTLYLLLYKIYAPLNLVYGFNMLLFKTEKRAAKEGIRLLSFIVIRDRDRKLWYIFPLFSDWPTTRPLRSILYSPYRTLYEKRRLLGI